MARSPLSASLGLLPSLVAEQIGVMVVKAVPIDRDGATSLIKAFIEYAVREQINVRARSESSGAGGAYRLAREFTDRYATLNEGEEVKGQ